MGSTTMSPGEDPDLHSKLQEHASMFMEKQAPAGMVIGYVDDTSTGVISFGETSEGNGELPDANSIFEIGSITKTFTAAALASLVVDGKLALDQPLGSLLPHLNKTPTYEGTSITLLHLATHTSGLPRLPVSLIWEALIPGRLMNPYKHYSARDLEAYLQSYELKQKPGEKADYSNVGMGALGYALSHYTGKTYEELITELVCEPLGMKDTVITPSAEQRERMVTGYTKGISLSNQRILKVQPRWKFHDSLAGGGALLSSANDMLTYVRANLVQTTSSLTPALELTHQPHFVSDDGTTYGLAWVKTSFGTFHDGGTGGFSSLIAFDKPTSSGVVVLCNTSNEQITYLGLNLLVAIQAHKNSRQKD